MKNHVTYILGISFCGFGVSQRESPKYGFYLRFLLEIGIPYILGIGNNCSVDLGFLEGKPQIGDLRDLEDPT